MLSRSARKATRRSALVPCRRTFAQHVACAQIRLAGTSKHGGVRALAADIVALAVKNNEKFLTLRARAPAAAPRRTARHGAHLTDQSPGPRRRCQQWAMEGGALQAMMALHLGIVAGEDGAAAGVGDGEKAKALSDIAALVQNFAPAERQFLAADGATLLRDALAPGRPARLRARAAFFMQWLLRDSPPARAAALATHAVPNLALASADAANGLHAGPSPLPFPASSARERLYSVQ